MDRINQGREFIRIQGVIRPVDTCRHLHPFIQGLRRVDSYGGQGAPRRSNRPGLLSRFFNSRWNPL